MILVLAGRRDRPARRLVERWRARGARLLTPADLSRTGWCHHVGEPGEELAVASRERIAVAELEGVITRIPSIAPEDLPHVAEADREYAAAEMSAFLLAWLAGVPCPVLNRPVASGLMGAPHAPEGWAALAARAGLRTAWQRRSYPRDADPWPATATPVAVLGERCFDEVDAELARQAGRLAREAGVELMEALFSDASRDAIFLGAHLWPDVSRPALADALLARMEMRA